jgi:3-hydroxyacyl-[acyl-carrier-protein] dehydratase
MSIPLPSIDVRRFLPHRPPFLFVDNASIDDSMERIRTTHAFQPDEPYFEGHFPGDPIVPGVVLIECMAQACRLLLNLRAGEIIPGFLVGVETGKFLSIVRPNQTVSFECRFERSFANAAGATSQPMYTFRCSASVDNVRCARAHLNLYQKQKVAESGGSAQSSERETCLDVTY